MRFHLLILALSLSPALPVLGSIEDVTKNPYPDPDDRLAEARSRAAAGGTLETWALAEALIAAHAFDESDNAFRDAARAALEREWLELRDLGLLADRLEQRRLWDLSIRVRESKSFGTKSRMDAKSFIG